MNLEFASFDWVTVLAIAATAAALIVLRQRQKNRLLFWWRAGTLSVLLLLVLQPSVLRHDGGQKPLVAVAVDTSPSMYLGGRIGPARTFIDHWLGDFRKHWQVPLYRFDQGSSAVEDVNELKTAKTPSPTDIQRSLWEIKRERGDALAGIIVISDFNHNAAPLAPHWVSELNVPVITVSAGAGSMTRDVAIESLRVSDFAFKNAPLDITVHLSVQGARGEAITVNLKDEHNGALLATQRAVCDSDREEKDVTLRFTPVQSGRFRYTVEAVPLRGERATGNNRREFTLDVVRDKTRILFLCGQPGPEYAFLRHALKTDPSVELVSFVILRNPENIALVPENDLSLIPFPVHTLFTRDLYDFDALILDNFTYQRFGFMPEYLANIRNWVMERGGGLVMIAGKNSFGAGGWRGTAVEEVLPVTMDNPQDAYAEGLFAPVIDDGSHFITMVGDEGNKNAALWKNAPELDGCQAIKPRPGAQVLMRHPVTGAVVLAAWERGKGRAVAVGTNTTWRWALGSATPQLYNEFWKNVVRYVTKSGESKLLHLAFDRVDYAAGQEFRLKARSIEKYPGATIRAYVTGPSGRRILLQASRTGEKNWECRGTFSDAGKYRFEAVLEKGGTVLAREQALQKVIPALYDEETALGVNESLAREIAGDSGGACFRESEFSLAGVSAKLKKQEVRDVRGTTPLWTSPILLALCIASLAGEWYVRRRRGLR